MKNVTGAKCVKCGKIYTAEPDINTCSCGGILDIEYDYDYIKNSFSKDILSARTERSLFRYRELLPIETGTSSTPLRAGGSPLYNAASLAKKLGVRELYIKDDGFNPTSSLKDRASAIAVAKALEAGADTIACSSTGNAASSLAGAAAAAGLRSFIFVPERAPIGKLTQLMIFGAYVVKVKGDYADTFNLSRLAIEK